MEATRSLQQTNNRLFYWYSLLMAFPAILIFFNLSIYVFVFVYRSFGLRYRFNLSLKPLEAKLALLFILGVTVSLLDVWTLDQGTGRIMQGLAVWPNYLYWCIVIIFLCRHANHLPYAVIPKAFFWGLVISLIYFFVPFLYQLRNLPFLKGLQQNILSFLLIAFVPLALTFVRQKKGILAFWIAGILFSLLAFMTGSRSGSIFVTLGFLGMAVFYSGYRVMSAAIFLVLLSVFLLIDFRIDRVIKGLNQRTYDMIYSSKNVLEEDLSYLTRVAILKKGLSIYKRSPYTGAGINSFASFRAKISYDFPGGELIAHNDDAFQRSSAHNSYLSVLAECGLVGFVPFVLLLLVSLVRLCYNVIFKSRNAFGVALLLGYTFMLTHMYFISGILNVFAWFMIGLVCAYNRRIKTLVDQRSFGRSAAI